jgi:hypothetical protein
MKYRISKKATIIIFSVASLPILLYLLLLQFIAIDNPNYHVESYKKWKLEPKRKDTYVLGKNWLTKAPSGLWEMYLEGNPLERGIVNGKLSKELVYRQESYFSQQLMEMVPNSLYREVLKLGIGWFTRDIDEYISGELKQEIYGISLSASKDFNHIANPYQRLLTYHAAHDIGHAVQNMALVGCSSLATWGSKSSDGHLIVGRNFDFYVNDNFAKEKIILFQRPDKGIPFACVTWGGMVGVVSGLNISGLSVTLNAAPSEIPSQCATPVSLIAREILQYSNNIKEAVQVASRYKVFVSELIMVGSRLDNKAVVFEITPDTLIVHEPVGENLICTNHFSTSVLSDKEINRKQIHESSTGYRYSTLKSIVDTLQMNTPLKTSDILRRRKGINNEDLGNGNELSLNQLIAHHSVVFNLTENIMWVSEGPWQLGPFSAYDLDEIFKNSSINERPSLSNSGLRINRDSFMDTQEYHDFVEFKGFMNSTLKGVKINPDSIIKKNPMFYKSYVLAADQYFSNNQFAKASELYHTSLNFAIPTLKEKNYILDKLGKCDVHVGK